MKIATRLLPDGVETERFRLRLLGAEDEALYRQIYCSPETMRYVGTPLSIEQATRSFHAALKQTANSEGGTRFLIAGDQAGNVTFGVCGASFALPGWDTAEIGIMLSHNVRGQGYAHEVLGGFIDYVFASSKVAQVQVRYAAEQTAVVRLNNGLGFVVQQPAAELGDSRQSAYIDRSVWQKSIQFINRG